MEQAVERANKVIEKKTSRVFIPKMKPELRKDGTPVNPVDYMTKR